MSGVLKKAVFMVVFAIGFMFCITASANEAGVVSLSSGSLNVRSGAGANFDKVASLKNGAAITIISNENGWMQIQSGSVTGYVSSDFIRIVAKDFVGPVPVVNNTNGATYGTRWVGGQVITLNVRSGPGTNNGKIGGLSALTPVTVVDKDGEWAKIEFNGGHGWVAAEYLASAMPTLVSRSSSAGSGGSVDGRRLAEYASSERFLGIPYKYAGSTLSGFDCSGFVMYVYKQFGYNLPHSSKSQYGYGTAVSKGDLAPGDVVFFKGTSGSGIGHVGIYIGNSNFVHARSTGRPLGINSLNEATYVKRWVGARRIIN